MKYGNKFLAVITLIIFVNPLYASNKNNCGAINNKKIQLAIKSFLDTHDTIKYDDIIVTSKLCDKGFARATIHPIKPTTDDATLYLKKTKAGWQVINYGTDFSPDFLAKMPKALVN